MSTLSSQLSGTQMVELVGPPTGADITYSFRTRVQPSSRTVTVILPRVTSERSTGTGCGRKASTRRPNKMTAATVQNMARKFSVMSLSGLQNGYKVHAIELASNE